MKTISLSLSLSLSVRPDVTHHTAAVTKLWSLLPRATLLLHLSLTRTTEIFHFSLSLEIIRVFINCITAQCVFILDIYNIYIRCIWFFQRSSCLLRSRTKQRLELQVDYVAVPLTLTLSSWGRETWALTWCRVVTSHFNTNICIYNYKVSHNINITITRHCQKLVFETTFTAQKYIRNRSGQII